MTAPPRSVHARQRRARVSARRERGFTLVELLISMADHHHHPRLDHGGDERRDQGDGLGQADHRPQRRSSHRNGSRSFAICCRSVRACRPAASSGCRTASGSTRSAAGTDRLRTTSSTAPRSVLPTRTTRRPTPSASNSARSCRGRPRTAAWRRRLADNDHHRRRRQRVRARAVDRLCGRWPQRPCRSGREHHEWWA